MENMGKEVLEALEKLSCKMVNKYDELEKRRVFSDIEKEMVRIGSKVSNDYLISFRLVLDVRDSQTKKLLHEWDIGVGVFGQGKPPVYNKQRK